MTEKTTSELLRAAFELVPVLYTVPRGTSRSGNTIKLDCFVAKPDSPGLVKITELVADALGIRQGLYGIRCENTPKAGEWLAAALSDALELPENLKHERV